MKSEEKIQYNCRRIKILADGEKCVEVMITDKLVIPYDREENPLKKCFVTYAISICVINYAISVKSAL